MAGAQLEIFTSSRRARHVSPPRGQCARAGAGAAGATASGPGHLRLAGAAPLASYRDAIDYHFGHDRMEEIMASLERGDDWAQQHGIEHWRFDLAPGDALVIPAFWFHAVRSTGDFNVNVNFWSMPGQAYLSRFLLSLAR
jgi:hypothetical protein